MFSTGSKRWVGKLNGTTYEEQNSDIDDNKIEITPNICK
tara:strand:+ start:1342 stop:1458 length:117 start_codon:yes stop_codon:yes gene_type:complete